MGPKQNIQEKANPGNREPKWPIKKFSEETAQRGKAVSTCARPSKSNQSQEV
jgi:hypothetical protein